MPTALLVYANGSEDLEITAPADVLTRGGVKITRAAIAPEGEKTVSLAHGTTVICDCNIADCKDEYDLIVVPGGLPGAEYCRNSAALVSLLKRQHEQKRYIGAICAAPGMVLAHHGIITSGPATGYPGFEEKMPGYTGNGVEHDTENRIITGKGPGYCIEFALMLLEMLRGKAVADKVASGMLVTR